MFLRNRRVPFVNSYAPNVDVKLRVVASLAGLVLVSFALAWMERWSFRSAAGYVALLTVLGGLSLSLAVFERASSGPAVAPDLDEQPALPTQRLNLAH